MYVERNAMRPWLTDLKRQGKIVLVLFPYDGHNPGGVQIAIPSVVTCDSTWVTLDMTIPISDMDASGRDRGRRAPPRQRLQVRLSRVLHDGQDGHPAARGGA